MSTIQKLCEKLWQLEDEFDLLDLEIQNVKVWQYIRIQLYYEIAEKTGALETPHSHKKSYFSRLVKIYSYTKSLLFFNPFFTLHRCFDEVVIEHPRSKIIDGKSIDIYSHYYLDKLRKNELSYIVLDRPFLNGVHSKTDTRQRSYLDTLILISTLRAIFYPVRFKDKDKDLIKVVQEALTNKFGVEINLFKIFTSAITKFKSNYAMYSILFSKWRPEKLTMVVSYAYGDAIQAAKDLCIETVELQHGTLSRYHLGYSFPNRVEKLEYFPDKFLAWGEYWVSMDVLPLSKSNVKIEGFTHFINLRDGYNKIVRNKNQILILSQGALGPQIADEVLANIEGLSDYVLIYKLHPGEYSRWRDYKSLVVLSQLPNVKIVKDEDIYKLFSESFFQVGVFSTAIYEGIGFSCKTILLDLPGIEYMQDLINNDVVNVLRKEETIYEVVKKLTADENINNDVSYKLFSAPSDI